MKRLFFIVWCVGTWLTACSDEQMQTPSADECIRLGASVSGIEAATRAANPYKGAAPSASNPFVADVWFSQENGTYGNVATSPATHLPCHAKMTFDGSLVYAFNENGENLKYNTDGTNVYCVGFYPQGVWKANADFTAASATIDGSADLMFAPQLVHTWNNPFREQPYNHLLTWLKVCVCATDQDAAETWGDIEYIKVNNQHTNIEVTLADGDVQYTGARSFDIDATSTGNLHTTLKEFGSILCAPAKEYTLTVKTKKKDERTVTITLKDWTNGTLLTEDKQAEGKLFILTLYFDSFDVVEGVCTLNSWNNQSEDLYLK